MGHSPHVKLQVHKRAMILISLLKERYPVNNQDLRLNRKSIVGSVMESTPTGRVTEL